jgi:Cytochrome c7 and related cytochrome c
MRNKKTLNVIAGNRIAVWAASVCILVATALAATCWAWADSNTQQPIAFPHKTHVGLGLPCTACHQRAEKDSVAGKPPTALCLGCHGGGDTNSDEIKKLRQYGESGKDIPWKRVWRLPAHVSFPHQVHVTFAQITCQTCHGPMETLTSPPTRPLKTLTMSDCISCHERQKAAKAAEGKPMESNKVALRPASADCTFCHR